MKELVIYFSRADENYDVGNIKVGNTELMQTKYKKYEMLIFLNANQQYHTLKIIQSAVMKQKNTKKATLDLN